MTAHRLELSILDDHLAVCKLDPAGNLPSWATRSDFFSITRTHGELSIVCPKALVPADVGAEKGWRCLRVAGAMDFSLDLRHGLPARQEKDLGRAIEALVASGHTVRGPIEPTTAA